MSAPTVPRSAPVALAVPLAIAASWVVIDQVSKYWAVLTLGPQPFQHTLTLGFPWLRLTYGRNTGVAFGLFQNMPALFTATSIVITLGLIYAYVSYLPNAVRLVQVASGLILGGGLGNIVDRLRLGYVVDFISVGWWPIFNLADSAITVGVSLLASYLIFIGDEPRRATLSPPRDDGLLRDLLSRDLE